MTHADAIPTADLSGGKQVGQRLDEEALNSSLQRARAVLEIGTLQQEKLFRVGRNVDQERTADRSRFNSLPHHVELNIDYLAQFCFAKRPEDDDVIQAVHELRSEPAAGGGYSGARHARAQLCFAGGVGGLFHMEAEAWS